MEVRSEELDCQLQRSFSFSSHASFICQHEGTVLEGRGGNGWGTSADGCAAAEHVNAATLRGIDETAR
jgi:hypothetical protein